MRPSDATPFYTQCLKVDKIVLGWLSQRDLHLYLRLPQHLFSYRWGMDPWLSTFLPSECETLGSINTIEGKHCHPSTHDPSSPGCSCTLTSPFTSSATPKDGLTISAFLRSPIQSSLPAQLTPASVHSHQWALHENYSSEQSTTRIWRSDPALLTI